MPESLEIQIKASAEYQAIQKTAKELESLIAHARAAGVDTGELERQLAGVNAQLGKNFTSQYRHGLQELIKAEEAAGRSTQHLHAQLDSLHNAKAPGGLGKIGNAMREGLGQIPGLGPMADLASGMNVAGLAAGVTAAGVAIGVAVNVLKDGYRELAEAQEGMAKLDTALAQRGHLFEGYREQLQGMADDLEQATAIADDEWLGVLTKLHQFGSTPQSIGMDVEAVKNLAGIMGGDLNSAAMIWGKAMQGNMEMLGRYGVHVDEHASKSEKLRQAMEDIARKGGGQLEARLQTLGGKWDLLLRNLENGKKTVAAIAERFLGLGSVLNQVNLILSYWADKFSQPIESIKGLSNSIDDVKTSLEDLGKADPKALEKIGDAADRTKNGLTASLEAARELKRFLDEMADLDMASELADIDPTKPKSEQLRQEKEIRQRYAKAKLDREKDAATGAMSEHGKTADEAEAKINAGYKAVSDQEARVKAAKDRRDLLMTMQSDKKRLYDHYDAMRLAIQQRDKPHGATDFEGRDWEAEKSLVITYEQKLPSLIKAAEDSAKKLQAFDQTHSKTGNISEESQTLKRLNEELTAIITKWSPVKQSAQLNIAKANTELNRLTELANKKMAVEGKQAELHIKEAVGKELDEAIDAYAKWRKGLLDKFQHDYDKWEKENKDLLEKNAALKAQGLNPIPISEPPSKPNIPQFNSLDEFLDAGAALFGPKTPARPSVSRPTGQFTKKEPDWPAWGNSETYGPFLPRSLGPELPRNWQPSAPNSGSPDFIGPIKFSHEKAASGVSSAATAAANAIAGLANSVERPLIALVGQVNAMTARIERIESRANLGRGRGV